MPAAGGGPEPALGVVHRQRAGHGEGFLFQIVVQGVGLEPVAGGLGLYPAAQPQLGTLEAGRLGYQPAVVLIQHHRPQPGPFVFLFVERFAGAQLDAAAGPVKLAVAQAE